ncbi:MAG: hypothetical protein Q8R15_03390, partial [Candidatus Micrarchaeota archaeon]|nr:hypothetical protein [Candidatus Micrarchaeota archaeon]
QEPNGRISLEPTRDASISISKGTSAKAPSEISTHTGRSREYPEFSLVSGKIAIIHPGNRFTIGNNVFEVGKVATELRLTGVSGPVQDKQFVISGQPSISIGSDPKLSHIALIAAAVKAGKKAK